MSLKVNKHMCHKSQKKRFVYIFIFILNINMIYNILYNILFVFYKVSDTFLIHFFLYTFWLRFFL